jgi:hypothetical protein
LLVLGLIIALTVRHGYYSDWEEAKGKITGTRQKINYPRGLEPDDPNYEESVTFEYCAEITYLPLGTSEKTAILESPCKDNSSEFIEGSYLDILYNPKNYSDIQKQTYVQDVQLGLVSGASVAGIISLFFICLSIKRCKFAIFITNGYNYETSSYPTSSPPVTTATLQPSQDTRIYHAEESASAMVIQNGDFGGDAPFAAATILPENDPSSNQKYISPSSIPTFSGDTYRVP